jgi:hypothetical protein
MGIQEILAMAMLQGIAIRGVAGVIGFAVICGAGVGVAVDAMAQQPGGAAAQSLPAPESLFERHIEAIGGEAAMRKHTSIKFTGTVKIAAHNYSAFMTTWQAAPNSIITNIEAPGMAPMVVATDGKDAWGFTPPPTGTGWALIDGERKQELQFSAAFYGELEYESRYAKLQTIERADFDGKTCWKVYAESHEGKKFFLFFDEQTGLLLGSHTELNQEGVRVPLIVVLDEYTEVDGVKYVRGLTQRTPSSDTVLSYRKIEPNPADLPEIKLPEELRGAK